MSITSASYGSKRTLVQSAFNYLVTKDHQESKKVLYFMDEKIERNYLIFLYQLSLVVI